MRYDAAVRWAWLLFGLAACGGSAPPPRQASENPIVEYFTGAELQVETDDQRAVIEQALRDMETLPVAALQEKRYPDYQLTPESWDLPTLLERYYVPGRAMSIRLGFWEHVGAPDSRAVARRLRYELRP